MDKTSRLIVSGLLKLIVFTIAGSLIFLASVSAYMDHGSEDRRAFAEQMNDDEHHPNRASSTNKVYFFTTGMGDRAFSWTTANTESCDASFEFTLHRPKFLTILREHGFLSIACNGMIRNIPEQSEIDQMPVPPLKQHKDPAAPHHKTDDRRSRNA
jgi:hypothetical protein